MKKLTSEDIQKISLYIPFEIMFEPLSSRSILCCSKAHGIIGSRVINNIDDDDIQESSDISHPENDDRPILRLLETMTKEEKDHFVKLLKIKLRPDDITISHITKVIMDNSTPEAVFYALSKHFDLFNLIKNGMVI